MRLFFIGWCMALAACSSSLPNLPRGETAYTALPVPKNYAESEYRIGALDTITINVFQEPDLSQKELAVDASGAVLMPLIGSVQVGGKTASEVSMEIAARLRRSYLVSPQVSVAVVESSVQRVTVEGSVTDPGVYPIKGRTTLIDALALAKGPLAVARLNEIVVFRSIEGKRAGALFDLQAIRRGEAEDPEILGGDRVVVGLSGLKQTYRDILQTAPLLASFRLLF